MTRFVVTLVLMAIAAELISDATAVVDTTIPATAANGLQLLVMALFFRLLTGIQDPQRFTQVYLLSIVAKILLACVLIVVLILFDRAHARDNVIFVFATYVAFTVAEVFFLVRLRRAHDRAKKNQKISF